MCNGYGEYIPAIKDCNGRIITDSIEKVNSFNSFYSTVFSSKGSIHIYREKTRANLSLLILKPLGEVLERHVKTNQ